MSPDLSASEKEITSDMNAVFVSRETMIRMHEARTNAKLDAHADMSALAVGGSMGSVNVVPQSEKSRRRSRRAIERMEELGFDPMEQSVKIAQGQLYRENHWWRPVFDDKVQDVVDRLDYLTPSNLFEELDAVRTMLLDLQADGLQALRKYQTPINLRSQHTIELMGYVYPKMKSVEHTVAFPEPNDDRPLTTQEIEQFKDVFESIC